MYSTIIKFLFGTALRKWATGAVVTALLSGVAAFGWHSYKDSLRDEGRDEAIQQCNESIYQANQVVLEEQLSLEKQRVAALEQRNLELWEENQSAIQRRSEAEDQVTQLLRERDQQASNDENYREWTVTSVPSGVNDRLQRAARNPDPSEDSN